VHSVRLQIFAVMQTKNTFTLS